MTTITEPALQAGSDEGLMQRIQADDVGAFEELYDRYSAQAFGVARGICGNSHRAEDAVQEGFVAVWRSRGSFDPARGSVRAWLFTVIRHRSLDLTRRTRRDDDRRSSGDALGFLLALDSVEQDAEAHAEAARVRSSLLKLQVTQREVILLAYFAGLTHTEIAARLKLPTGTVKGRMRLGLKKVTAELDPSGPPHQRQTHTKLHSRPSPATH
jgi:RNA polymerase sigma-70 factor (ECF subfamily)